MEDYCWQRTLYVLLRIARWVLTDGLIKYQLERIEGEEKKLILWSFKCIIKFYHKKKCIIKCLDTPSKHWEPILCVLDTSHQYHCNWYIINNLLRSSSWNCTSTVGSICASEAKP